MIRRIRDAIGRIVGNTDQTSKQTRDMLRQVFSGQQGNRALAWLLTDLGYFDTAVDAQTGELLTGERLIAFRANQDYARRLLEVLGILDEMNVEELTRQMMELPVGESE